MTELAIIGGSGFDQLSKLTIHEKKMVSTPFGEPSAPLLIGEIFGLKLVFLPRHGDHHAIAPHNINYRANVFALKMEGVKRVIALAAVGGITPAYPARSLAIPHQIIDYTSAREHTYYDGRYIPDSTVEGVLGNAVNHVDFSEPFDEELRLRTIQAAQLAGVKYNSSGVYAATQGPRFETSAEINRLERDGADIVGMTVMPEAALAKELELAYACIALVVNAAAGRGDDGLSMEEIVKNLVATTYDVLALLARFK